MINKITISFEISKIFKKNLDAVSEGVNNFALKYAATQLAEKLNPVIDFYEKDKTTEICCVIFDLNQLKETEI